VSFNSCNTRPSISNAYNNDLYLIYLKEFAHDVNTRPRPLALSITLLLMAGCSGNQDAANAQHSREPTADKAPASTPTKTDVVSHYADLAHATFQDAVTTAEVLGEVVDARLWPVC
jgi:hypothetical protein